jgi:hypothetical protein
LCPAFRSDPRSSWWYSAPGSIAKIMIFFCRIWHRTFIPFFFPKKSE